MIANKQRFGLPADEERALARRWCSSNDEAALHRLVGAHLGLVLSVARQFRDAGPARDDLVQEGSLGLVVAARRFDPDRGTRLSTYAMFWIRAYILEHIVRSHGAVRVGTTRDERRIFFNLARARRRLEREGESVSDAALAGALDVDEEVVARMTPRLVGRDRSIDQPVAGAGGEHEAPSLVAAGLSPEELVASGEESAAGKLRLGKALERLDRRERLILKARFFSDPRVTLTALGSKLRLSRERVRQIEQRALVKLRLRWERG